MNEFYLELYNSLITGIDECWKQHTDYKNCIECCFHISESTNLQIVQKIAAMKFENEDEEILFFKTIKPLFAGHVEFYSILYRAELFAPDSPEEKQAFRKEEMTRVLVFFEKHHEFYQYVRSGETHRDREYFLRSPGSSGTSQDVLLARIVDREKYMEYLRDKFGL